MTDSLSLSLLTSYSLVDSTPDTHYSSNLACASLQVLASDSAHGHVASLALLARHYARDHRRVQG